MKDGNRESGSNMDACQQQCVLLLEHDPDNEVMLAELMFHKATFDSAFFPLPTTLPLLPPPSLLLFI